MSLGYNSILPCRAEGKVKRGILASNDAEAPGSPEPEDVARPELEALLALSEDVKIFAAVLPFLAADVKKFAARLEMPPSVGGPQPIATTVRDVDNGTMSSVQENITCYQESQILPSLSVQARFSDRADENIAEIILQMEYELQPYVFSAWVEIALRECMSTAVQRAARDMGARL